MPEGVREATDEDYVECELCSKRFKHRVHYPKAALERLEPSALPFGNKARGWRCPHDHVISEGEAS